MRLYKESILENSSIVIKNKNELMKSYLVEILSFIGDDPTREDLLETPARIVKSWGEIYMGYNMSAEDILSKTFSAKGYQGIVACTNIEFYSTCEHHMQPIYGFVHIGYVPRQKILGISKLPRVVECFTRRLQTQENITFQIAEALNDSVKPDGVAVVVEGRHFCMCSRGIGKQNASMVTSEFWGCFEKNSKKEELYNIINFKKKDL